MSVIDHIIVLTPENRSFHYVLGFLEDHRDHYNYDLQGNRIVCSPIDPMTGGDAIIHDIAATTASIQGIPSGHKGSHDGQGNMGSHDGQGGQGHGGQGHGGQGHGGQGDRGGPMTGFVQANQRQIYNTDAYETTVYQADPHQIMGYVKEGSLPILHTLAKNFCVCNRWFGSAPTETFPNRAFMIAGTSGGRESNLPKKIWGLISNQTTIFDRLTQAGLSWKIYYPNYLDLITNLDLDRPSMMTHMSGLMDLIADLQNNRLPVYSYVELDTNDDSIPELVPYLTSVEAYIGQVYNALRSSPYWTKTLLIISYDEHGGFYDPIIPPSCPSPDDIAITYHSSAEPTVARIFKFDQLGPRVPAILISPWLDAGIDETVYDHTSVLAFLEHRFNLSPLTQRDAQANYQFKFRSTLRSDDLLRQLPIPGTQNPDDIHTTPVNRILMFMTTVLVKLGHILNLSKLIDWIS